jgi:hypothetical protein
MMADANGEAQGRRIGFFHSTLFRWAVFAALAALYVFVHVKLGGLLILQTNHTDKEMRGGDQLHNMRLATQVASQDLHPDFNQGFTKAFLNYFPHRTDGVVQPLWPWIAAWLVKDGHVITEADMQAGVVREPAMIEMLVDLFHRGKWFHVFFTVIFIVCVGIAACRIFSLPASLNLMMLGGLGALLPRAVFFQPEPVYFVFFFLTWVACVSALKHNSLWIYGLIGVLGGIAYMAKGSISPLLAVFVAISSLRCAWEIVSAKRRGFRVATGNLWHWRNHLVGLVVLCMMHLLTIGPRLCDSQEKFGSMFHSFPAYWMWFDKFGGPDTVNDPTTAYGWMDRHNTREELDAMLPQDTPSPGNYLRTHSRQEVIDRLWNGLFSVKNPETGVIGRVREFFWPQQTTRSDKIEKQKPWRGILEWRGIYLLWLGAVGVALLVVLGSATPKPEHAGHVVFRHGTVSVVLFVLGSVAGYSVLYAFYAPIARGSGDRFMLSLYLPLVFSLIWGAESIVRRIKRREGSPWISRGYLLAQWMLFAALCWRLVEIFRVPQFYDG